VNWQEGIAQYVAAWQSVGIPVSLGVTLCAAWALIERKRARR